eukprot:TRINITY_DN22068_c1_g1_i2.p1 TRINITY_DN22068_c1_g1~~TRINITY_DN22068_c1_g1_i2.p1  ORF type:complete len:886 (-),score=123.32 TRINITY_DN22068_c1_g1_i2:96-2753(-)
MQRRYSDVDGRRSAGGRTVVNGPPITGAPFSSSGYTPAVRSAAACGSPPSSPTQQQFAHPSSSPRVRLRDRVGLAATARLAATASCPRGGRSDADAGGGPGAGIASSGFACSSPGGTDGAGYPAWRERERGRTAFPAERLRRNSGVLGGTSGNVSPQPTSRNSWRFSGGANGCAVSGGTSATAAATTAAASSAAAAANVGGLRCAAPGALAVSSRYTARSAAVGESPLCRSASEAKAVPRIENKNEMDVTARNSPYPLTSRTSHTAMGAIGGGASSSATLTARGSHGASGAINGGATSSTARASHGASGAINGGATSSATLAAASRQAHPSPVTQRQPQLVRTARALSALRCRPRHEPQRARSADVRRKGRVNEDGDDSHFETEIRVAEALPLPSPTQHGQGRQAAGGSPVTRGSAASPCSPKGGGSPTSPQQAFNLSCQSLRRPPPFKYLPSSVFGGRYTVGRFLGRGASATVWEAIHTDTQLRVAVKVFDQGAKDRRQAAREAFEVVEATTCSHLVCELIDGESLRAYAQRHPGQRLQEEDARRYYRQVVDGVCFCHDRLVVHRDLKLENLLLDKSHEHVKIIDFGFAAQVVSKDTKLRAFCGTPSYMAPEIIRGEGYSGFAADVWALGVVIFALLAAVLPFAGRTEMQLYAKIRRGIYHFPDVLGETVRRLVRSLLRMEASMRPPACALLRNAWVVGVTTAEADAAATATSDASLLSEESAPAAKLAPVVSPSPVASFSPSPVSSPPSAGRPVTAGADAAGGGSIGAGACVMVPRVNPEKGSRHTLGGSTIAEACLERTRPSPEKASRHSFGCVQRDGTGERPRPSPEKCHRPVPSDAGSALQPRRPSLGSPSLGSPKKTGFGGSMKVTVGGGDVKASERGL